MSCKLTRFWSSIGRLVETNRVYPQAQRPPPQKMAASPPVPPPKPLAIAGALRAPPPAPPLPPPPPTPPRPSSMAGDSLDTKYSPFAANTTSSKPTGALAKPPVNRPKGISLKDAKPPATRAPSRVAPRKSAEEMETERLTRGDDRGGQAESATDDEEDERFDMDSSDTSVSRRSESSVSITPPPPPQASSMSPKSGKEVADRPETNPPTCWAYPNFIVHLVLMSVDAVLLGAAMYTRLAMSDYTLTVHLRDTTYPIWSNPSGQVITSYLSGHPMPVDFLIWAAIAADMIKHALTVLVSKCCVNAHEKMQRFREDWYRWFAHVVTNTMLDTSMIVLCGIVEIREVVAYAMLAVFMHSAQVAHEHQVTGYSSALTRTAPFIGSVVLFLVVYGMTLNSINGIGYYAYPLGIFIVQAAARVTDYVICVIQWVREKPHTRVGGVLNKDDYWGWYHNELAHCVIAFLVSFPAYALLMDKSARPV